MSIAPTAASSMFSNAILEATPDPLIFIDREGQVKWTNEAALVLFGYSKDEVVDHSVLHFVHADDMGRLARILDQVNRDITVSRPSVRLLSRSGGAIAVSITATVLDDHPVLGSGIVVAARPSGISAESAGDEVDRLGIFEVVDCLPEAVIVHVPDHGVVFRNQAAEHLFGVSRRDAVLLPMDAQFVEGADGDLHRFASWLEASNVETFAPTRVRLDHHDGRVAHLEVTGAPLVNTIDGTSNGRVVAFADVTRSVAAEQALHQLSEQDELTGLANRRGLLGYLGRITTPHTVVMIDLDHFKYVNDAYGHAVGDTVVVEVARRIASVIHDSTKAIAARLGGDEFVIAIDSADTSDPTDFAERLRSSVHPILLPPLPVEALTASLGFTTTDGTADPIAVLAEVDAAMYAAKDSGRNNVQRYRPDPISASSRRLHEQLVLRMAIDSNTLDMMFQPIVSIFDGRIVSAETLVRGPHNGELFTAVRLISAAERTGQLHEIDQRALIAALGLLERTAHIPTFSVSCNASVQTMLRADWPNLVAASINHVGIDPQRLVIECSERGLARLTNNAIAGLVRLSDLGVRLALDDFGLEEAGFGALSKLPVDHIKIDSRFVQQAVSGRVDRAILSSIADLGRSLDMQLVGEGVETAEQQSLLADLGVQMAQGFLFSPAIPADELVRHLNRNGHRY